MKCCETCRWRGELLAAGDNEDPALYLCEWPSDLLPWSLRWGGRERVAVYANEGTDCPQYKKETG